MRTGIAALLIGGIVILSACGENNSETKDTEVKDTTEIVEETSEFDYNADEFADIQVLRYKVPGFDELGLKTKKLLYYLYRAAIAGRDITWDQNFKYNLAIRKTIENIINTYSGEKSGEDWDNFIEYSKRVFFSNGIHHHYSNDKILPKFSKEYFAELVKKSDQEKFPVREGETVEQMHTELTPIIFDPTIAAKKTEKGAPDNVVASAVNFYEGVTNDEVDAFYANKPKKGNQPSWGLNSKLVKEDGKIVEKTYKVGGMYSAAIEEIVDWLEKAVTVAENPEQQKALELLVKYYKSGDLADFDSYNIAWVNDTKSDVDVINGFIEVYADPIGKRGSFESVVSVKDPEASKRIEAIGAEAQWFEDNSPIMDSHKKANVQGISARVINVVMESGDASPATPIGINLPNSNWIRSQHGSKSVNLGNIVHAYDEAAKSGGVLEEFAFSQEEIDRAKKDGGYSDKLHTDMHEVIGHASGVINEGVGETDETLRNYASTLEEGRADLVALYYLMDQKLIDIGVMEDMETGKAAYDDYIRNGMMLQLNRIEPGKNIEEDHMRNRQMIVKWAMEMGKEDNVIERKEKDGKTYFVINDYQKLRTYFGEQLKELQRIKSEGDFEAGKNLVETYGVKVDPELHQEVLDRFESLNLKAYKGFVNPKLVPVKNGGEITDVKIEYAEGFLEQMLEYGKNHSCLKPYN